MASVAASIRPHSLRLLQAVLAVNTIHQVIIILQCTHCHEAHLDILNSKENKAYVVIFSYEVATPPDLYLDLKDIFRETVPITTISRPPSFLFFFYPWEGER